MRKWILACACVAVAAALYFIGCGSPSCEDTKTCPPDASADALNEPPPGCDLAQDPKDSPACVDDSVGIFVDGTSGKDTNPGTKTAPVQTLTHGLSLVTGGKSRVYVCAGTYAEHVVLSSAVSVYGAFKCGAWTWDASATVTVKPSDPGFALKADAVQSAIVVEDIEFDSKAGSSPGESSVAGFVNASSDVTLKRDKLVAGTGITATSGGTLPTNAKIGLGGIGADAGPGGSAQPCSCGDGTTSTGGKGGDANVTQAQGGADGGANPMPTISGTFYDGAGGIGFKQGTNFCGQGHSGANGNIADGGAGAAAVGALSATGWTPQAGADGKIGGPGQGGGGGGGGAAFGGGGGGCGGCGGAGGKGGAGGGASIALLILQSNVKLVTTTLIAAGAGDGGAGGTGEAGGGGGGGSLGACSGGDGANGSGGGGGGGGAGGVSAGIVWKGSIPPTVDGTPQTTATTLANVTLGKAGAAGTKGGGGTAATTNGNVGNAGSAGTDGIAGVAQAILQVP